MELKNKTYAVKIRATLVLINSWGVPIVRPIWLHKFQENKEGWSKKSLSVWYTIKGERKKRGHKMEQATLCEGWQDIKGGFNNEATEFTCFNDDAFNFMANQMEKVIV